MSDQAMTRGVVERLCANVRDMGHLQYEADQLSEIDAALREELAQVKQERDEALAALLQIQTACGLGRNSQDDLVDVIARMYAKIAELEARRCT